MAWAHVQNAVAGTASGGAATLAVTTSAIVAGHYVLIAISCNSSATISSVIDSASNSYGLLYTETINGAGATLYIYGGLATTGGATAVNITASVSANIGASVDEFSFTQGTASIASHAINDDTAGVSATTTSGNVSWARSALVYNAVGLGGTSVTFTQGTGFSLWGNLPLVAGSNLGIFTQGILNDLSSPVNPTGTLSASGSPWASVGIALQSSGDLPPASISIGSDTAGIGQVGTREIGAGSIMIGLSLDIGSVG